MNVGATDRSGGDAHQGIKRADIRNRFLFENDAARLDKDGRLHLHLRHIVRLRLSDDLRGPQTPWSDQRSRPDPRMESRLMAVILRLIRVSTRVAGTRNSFYAHRNPALLLRAAKGASGPEIPACAAPSAHVGFRHLSNGGHFSLPV